MSDKKITFPLYGLIGLAVIAVSEALLFLRFSFVPVYFTPLAWSGYILFVEGLNYKLRGESLIRTRTREFLVMLPWSVLCWLVFELYNLHTQSWIYVGLPQNLVARLAGFVWSFATIFPAVLETADLLQLLFQKFRLKPRKISQTVLYSCMILGFLCLSFPALLPHSTARFLIPFVWLGFALLMEPINYLLGGTSLFQYFEVGELKQSLSLVLSGLVCGLLWEFWNYWADARWIYNLPFSWAGPRIFEMRLFGFLGFMPFAVECHAMQNYLLALFIKTAPFTHHPVVEAHEI
jgi:hypothetical protein